MGESKNRGTKSERIAAALASLAHTKPPALECNVCRAALPTAERVDTRALNGIEVAFKAHCAACDQDTWAVRGEPPAVRAFYSALEKSVGGHVQLSSVKPPLSS